MNEITLIEKGLNEQEAKVLAKWIEDGKPGALKYNAEKLGEIYCLGYSCQEIVRWFPEYPYEIVLWARLYFKWDEIKDKYRSVVQKEILQAAITTRLESIRFISDVLSASHLKWRKEILSYLADPNRKDIPKILPDNIYNYSQLVNQLKELTDPAVSGSKDGDVGMTPLVSVTVNSGMEKKQDIVITHVSQEDIKNALREDLERGTGN